jgi:hypothetical protein
MFETTKKKKKITTESSKYETTHVAMFHRGSHS